MSTPYLVISFSTDQHIVPISIVFSNPIVPFTTLHKAFESVEEVQEGVLPRVGKKDVRPTDEPRRCRILMGGARACQRGIFTLKKKQMYIATLR